MRKTIFYPPVFLFCALASFFQVARAAGPTQISDSIDVATSWTKENSPYVLLGQVMINAPLTIEAGTVVKLDADYHASLIVKNDFFVKGTRREPVVFTSARDDSFGGDSNNDGSRSKPAMADWTFISFNPLKDYALEINHAKVFYSSFGLSIYSSNDHFLRRTVKNSEFRHNGYALMIRDAQPVVENNLIAQNTTGVWVAAQKRVVTIFNNSIFSNQIGAEASNTTNPDLGALEAQNNWWGDESGPQNSDNPDRKGDIVKGFVNVDPWLKKDPFQGPDPAIVIPGIMGSWKKNGIWTIDPIFHTYDNLCEEFLANGYEDGKNFSVFPYEWRDSNVENAKLLARRIGDIKAQTGRMKVDLVAHSMGGLPAREYIESDYYAGDVDQLITIGTPQLGAPEDYITWEAGEFVGYLSPFSKRVFYQEAKENGYNSIFCYIHGRPMLSVQELLPVYDYLYDDNGVDYDLRAGYPTNYPRNEFLENLNSVKNVDKLKDVEFTQIIGNVNNSESTISGYNTVKADMGELWQDGYPHGFEIPIINDKGIKWDKGDRTVPLFSSENNSIPSVQKKYYETDHGSLPTEAQQDILEILTGKRPAGEITKWHTPDLLLILAHSPIDLQVESPSGQKIGKNFETSGIFDEIEGAYYTGFDTNSEFITIPNPKDGKYKIMAQGTEGGGDYEIEVAKIIQDESDPDSAQESAAIIKGSTQTGEVRERLIDVKKEKVEYNPDKTPPVIDVSSPKNLDYNNDRILAVEYLATDSESELSGDSWKVEKDGQDQGWTEKNRDLSLEHLGDYAFTAVAADAAGNSSEKSVEFRIVTNLGAIRNNLNHYFDLGLLKKKIAWKYFDKKLKNLEKIFGLLEKTKNSNLKPKPKQAAIGVLEKKINGKIGRLIRQINRKSPRWIDPQASELLIEDLNTIKIIK